MSVLRRAWRVLADPPSSELAGLIRNVAMPTAMVSVLLSFLPTVGLMLATPMDLLWLYVLLCVVRQRDQARADATALRKNVGCDS